MLSSLRSQLLVGITLSISLLLLLFGAVIYTTIHRSLLAEFDFALENMARTMAAAALVERGVIEVELAPELIPDFQKTRGELYFQYWVEDGAVLDRSTSLRGADLPSFHGSDEAPVLRSIRLPDGQKARAAGMRFRPAIEYASERPEGAIQTDAFPSVTVVVARETDELEHRLTSLLWLLTAAGTGATAVGLLVSVMVVARGLRPVRRLARDIAAVKEDELTNRIGVSGLPDEIQPVVGRLNELLERLEAAFARERGFTADVAHELRTPLAGIRSTVEVALSCPRSTEDYQEALGDTLEISKRLQAMIENLLMLARLDAGQATFHEERVRLAELVDDCWRPFSPSAGTRGLAFENRIPDRLFCASDRQSLATVMRNLLENCVEYAGRGGRVWVEGEAHPGVVEIKIANTDCHLTNEQMQHVFDRFWRADAARRDTGLHCGLGLALVRRIVTALGGSVTAQLEPLDVFSVTVALPAPVDGHG